LLGKSVFLSAAGGLVWWSHFQQALLHQRLDDLVPKLGPVTAIGHRHQIGQSRASAGFGKGFDLVPTWCLT
jgi:hypothetical protein